jgi:hypothetical protein
MQQRAIVENTASRILAIVCRVTPYLFKDAAAWKRVWCLSHIIARDR